MSESDIAKLLPLAYSIAQRVAWEPDHVDDLVQHAMLEVLTSFRRERKAGRPIHNLEGWVAGICWRWMKAWYTPEAREDRVLFLEDLAPGGALLVSQADAFQQTYIREYLSEVFRTLGPEEYDIAYNLVYPTAEVGSISVQEMEAKSRARHKGCAVRGFDTVVLKHEHIRKYLGMKEGAWDARLRRLRSFTRDWLEGGGRPPMQA